MSECWFWQPGDFVCVCVRVGVWSTASTTRSTIGVHTMTMMQIRFLFFILYFFHFFHCHVVVLTTRRPEAPCVCSTASTTLSAIDIHTIMQIPFYFLGPDVRSLVFLAGM